MQKRHKRQKVNTRADGRTSLGMGKREKGKQKVWRRWESYVAACVLRLRLPNSEGKEGRGGGIGLQYEIWAQESGNWWDGQVMPVMVVMEWANAVSARRRGEPNPAVTGAIPLLSSATRSLSEQPTINHFIS